MSISRAFSRYCQVLRGDGGDGDVVDVDLLFADQVQQQIERPLVVLQVNVQGR